MRLGGDVVMLSDLIEAPCKVSRCYEVEEALEEEYYSESHI